MRNVLQFPIGAGGVVIEYNPKKDRYEGYLNDRLVAFGTTMHEAAGRVIQRYSY